MNSKPYDPSDSLISVSLHSLDISEPDSPESSSSLVFRDGEWQLPLDEDDMNYQSFKPKMASSPLPPSGNISTLITANFYINITKSKDIFRKNSFINI